MLASLYNIVAAYMRTSFLWPASISGINRRMMIREVCFDVKN